MLIHCSTGCTRILTRAEKQRTRGLEWRRQSGVDANDRERQRNSTLKPDPQQRHQECTKRSPAIEAVRIPREWRRCQDAQSVQDEDRGQVCLRIDRNSYSEVQDRPGSQRSRRTN